MLRSLIILALVQLKCVNALPRSRQNLEKRIAQYLKNEYGWKTDGFQHENESCSDQMNQELRLFQRKFPLISLEVLIFLTFMCKKRSVVKDCQI